jgi:RNA polymerase sigma-70 factor (ECF subfamily)
MIVIAPAVPIKSFQDSMHGHGQLGYRPLQLWVQSPVWRTLRLPQSFIRYNNPHKIPCMQSEDTLQRAQQLDQTTLAQIHDQYYPEVYRYVRYRLDDEQVCEDISADVFLRLIDALHRKRGPKKNLRGWLFGTASNLVNDHFRKHYSRKIASLETGDELTDDHHPEEAFEENWQQEQVRLAIRQLTPEQQHVLALRFSGERSIDETASIMGKSVSAVKALQFRAVASLKRIISEEENKAR